MGELPREEARSIATEPFKNLRRVGLNRASDNCASACTRYGEIGDGQPRTVAAAKRSAVGDRQMFPVQTKSRCTRVSR